MVKEIRYTSIRRVLDNLHDHPMMSDLTLEQAVRHTLRFIGINGFPTMYTDKIDFVDIEEFRGLLPCDLISIIQVKDTKTGICLRSMTDSFTPGLKEAPEGHSHADKAAFTRHVNHLYKHGEPKELYIPRRKCMDGEFTFKTQGRVIFTSFPHGRIEIAYKSIPVDEDGFPMLIDNENYLAALEAYIKKQVFTVKFDQGKITAGVLSQAQSDYAWLAGELDAEFTIPSVSEMESITRMLNTLIPRVRQFDNGFKALGDREWLRKH